MRMAESEASFRPEDLLQIPVDLFVSKKHAGLSPGDLGFAVSSGNLLFVVRKSSSSLKSLLDSSGTPLFSISRRPNGTWEVYKGEEEKETEMVLKVKRTSNKFRQIELEVSFVGHNSGESPHLVVKGCPFQKSCTIYHQNSILAQTSLMYKLNQIYVGRSKFRLTIFPGSVDPPLVVALVAVFLEGRK